MTNINSSYQAIALNRSQGRALLSSLMLAGVIIVESK